MADNLPDNVTHCASSLDDIHITRNLISMKFNFNVMNT